MGQQSPPKSNGVAAPTLVKRTTTEKERTIVEEFVDGTVHTSVEEYSGDPLLDDGPQEEALEPESGPIPPEPGSASYVSQRRRQEDISAALAVTAGVAVPVADRRADVRAGVVATGRRLVDQATAAEQKAALEADFVEARDFWNRRLGRPPQNMAQHLKPWIREFGLGTLLATFERVRTEKPGGAIDERYRHLLNLLKQERARRSLEGGNIE
jgi:hypothetical protein